MSTPAIDPGQLNRAGIRMRLRALSDARRAARREATATERAAR